MNNSSPNSYPFTETQDSFVFSQQRWSPPSYYSNLTNHHITNLIPYFNPQYVTDADFNPRFDPFYDHEYSPLKKLSLPNIPTAPVEVKPIKSNFTSPSNDRPHGCDFPGCGRFFKRLEHVKRHYRSIHTKVRPYICPHCPKTFSRSDNLSQHSRTHRSSQSTESTVTSKSE